MIHKIQVISFNNKKIKKIFIYNIYHFPSFLGNISYFPLTNLNKTLKRVSRGRLFDSIKFYIFSILDIFIKFL